MVLRLWLCMFSRVTISTVSKSFPSSGANTLSSPSQKDVESASRIFHGGGELVARAGIRNGIRYRYDGPGSILGIESANGSGICIVDVNLTA